MKTRQTDACFGEERPAAAQFAKRKRMARPGKEQIRRKPNPIFQAANEGKESPHRPPIHHGRAVRNSRDQTRPAFQRLSPVRRSATLENIGATLFYRAPSEHFTNQPRACSAADKLAGDFGAIYGPGGFYSAALLDF